MLVYVFQLIGYVKCLVIVTWYTKSQPCSLSYLSFGVLNSANNLLKSITVLKITAVCAMMVSPLVSTAFIALANVIAARHWLN